jgi:hypothetical protein
VADVGADGDADGAPIELERLAAMAGSERDLLSRVEVALEVGGRGTPGREAEGADVQPGRRYNRRAHNDHDRPGVSQGLERQQPLVRGRQRVGGRQAPVVAGQRELGEEHEPGALVGGARGEAEVTLDAARDVARCGD